MEKAEGCVRWSPARKEAVDRWVVRDFSTVVISGDRSGDFSLDTLSPYLSPPPSFILIARWWRTTVEYDWILMFRVWIYLEFSIQFLGFRVQVL